MKIIQLRVLNVMVAYAFIQVSCMATEKAASAEETGSDEPSIILRDLIESDMNGDADKRVDIAAGGFTLDTPDCNQMMPGSPAFSLGDGGMEIAASWRFLSGNRTCSRSTCTLTVVYSVVGTTKGCGSPSWKSSIGWEIVPLPKVVERKVSYTFCKIGGAWKIRHFPPLYVSKEAMRGFFLKEISDMKEVKSKLPEGVDPRVMKNADAVMAWDQRQLDLIGNLAE